MTQGIRLFSIMVCPLCPSILHRMRAIISEMRNRSLIRRYMYFQMDFCNSDYSCMSLIATSFSELMPKKQVPNIYVPF